MARGVIPLGLRKGEGVIPAAPMSTFTNKPLSTVWMLTVLIDYYVDGEGVDTTGTQKGRGGNPARPHKQFHKQTTINLSC